MSNAQNLKPFKKGQSGNLNGRPRKLPELDILLTDILADEKNGMTVAAAILKEWVKLALKGNLKAGEMLLNRAYGQPKAPIEVNAPFSIGIVNAKSEQIAAFLKMLNEEEPTELSAGE
jgi:hypothetical protein